MKKINIFFWATSVYKNLPYTHKQTLEYSNETRLEIIDTCLSLGYYIMLKEYPMGITDDDSTPTLMVYIDHKRFTSR